MYESKVEIITPNIARGLLETTIINRDIRPMHVRALAGEMESGRWVLNGESLIISDQGSLLDGQHRCQAVVDSGQSIETIVVRGVHASVFDTLNSGKQRTFQDVLEIRGEPNARILANAAKRLWRFYQGDLKAQKKTPSNKELAQFLLCHSPLKESADFISGLVNTNAILPRGLACFGHYLFATHDKERADRFFEQVMSGVGLELGTGPWHFRERLLKRKASKHMMSIKEVTALMIKAWNAYKQNTPLKRLKWNKKEQFPKAA